MKLLSLLSSSLLTATLLLAVSPASAQEAPVKKKIAITKIAATDALKARMARQGVGLSLAVVFGADAPNVSEGLQVYDIAADGTMVYGEPLAAV